MNTAKLHISKWLNASPDFSLEKLQGRIIAIHAFQMRGTPTWIIFDKTGEMKIHAFGQIDDLALGAEIAKLAFENIPTTTNIYKKKGI